MSPGSASIDDLPARDQRRGRCVCVFIGAVTVLLILAACGETAPDHDPLLPRDARPTLVFATHTSTGDVTNAITGELEERDDCLRVVNDDGTDYVIAWPPGSEWSAGGMGLDPAVVVRKYAPLEPVPLFVAIVGDTLRVYGEPASERERERGCDGPVWFADDHVDVLARVPDGLAPPTPTTDAMDAYAIQLLADFHEPDAGVQPQVLLSRQLTPAEVDDLLVRFGIDVNASSATCARVDTWYCDPAATPWLVIVQGGWWIRDADSARYVTHVGLMVDRRADNANMIQQGLFRACDPTQFGALLHGIVLPDTTNDGTACAP